VTQMFAGFEQLFDFFAPGLWFFLAAGNRWAGRGFLAILDLPPCRVIIPAESARRIWVIMATILLVEDNPADSRTATNALAGLGLGDIIGTANLAEAHRHLDEVREGKREMPALIVLDLALGYESGFEILRRWRSDRNLSEIHVVVWTQMGEREQELCRLFGLKHVVPKWSPITELQDAVKSAAKPPSHSTQ